MKHLILAVNTEFPLQLVELLQGIQVPLQFDGYR